MTRQVEAVFEQGVLRPLEPLSLPEQQHVFVTITDVPVKGTGGSRQAEMAWLDAHGHEYLGQWVALQGDVLLSHGSNARAVRDEARQKGIQFPLLFHVPEDFGQPKAGWF
ncbi:MAG TPA: antitoxin AF2212-like protein [Candidatus Acidoferrales bacterium]|jgi:predicted DNA-binding antitoxin AbrB/MazE fold protein|nr:antitoxin AF2212-like protein [Candidatus Acidoferrales bacterium]